MAAAVEEPLVQDSENDEFAIVHIVCHCTDDKIAFCGWTEFKNETDEFDEEDLDCAMCLLVIESNSERCPWGCPCYDECNGVDFVGIREI